ncbi:hypothetical protein GCM10009547_29800 [Sporichthya brevicatena]|uniref:DUF5302 domain-containing protein n=1 Tax=Sporichthya brevicatena TaxID=171442 RepID=A0ABN1GZM5_9ACTN
MTENETPENATAADETEEPVEDVFAGDDPKAKFREALARKHGGGGKTSEKAGGDSKVHSAHGPAKAQRTFRRKSGG